MGVVVTVVFVSFAMLYFAYGQGVAAGHQQFEQDQALIVQLSNTIDTVKNELTVTQESLVISRRQQQIQEEAYKQMSQAYANSEQKNRVLGSRLDFYRSIISPEGGQSGPAIQDVNVSYDQGVLRFDVTLVQAIKHKHQVRGSLRASVYVGEQVVSKWPLSSERSINYQYFQQISGSMDIAELSNDAMLSVELVLQSGEKLERSFKLIDAVTSVKN